MSVSLTITATTLCRYVVVDIYINVFIMCRWLKSISFPVWTPSVCARYYGCYIYYLLHFTSCDGDGSQHNISPDLKQFKNKVNNHSELFPLASRLKMNVFQGITISSKVSPKKKFYHFHPLLRMTLTKKNYFAINHAHYVTQHPSHNFELS